MTKREKNEANDKKTYIARRKQFQYGKVFFLYVRKVLTICKNPASSRIQIIEILVVLTVSAFFVIPTLKIDFRIEHTKIMKTNECKRQALIKKVVVGHELDVVIQQWQAFLCEKVAPKLPSNGGGKYCLRTEKLPIGKFH